jgi:hypothetical protein
MFRHRKTSQELSNVNEILFTKFQGFFGRGDLCNDLLGFDIILCGILIQ